MIEKEYIESFHFGIPSKIHGHLAHDKIPNGVMRWFIYCIEDVPCHKQIVGSTTNPSSRWSCHKSTCNSRKSNSTGLSKHFRIGCPNDTEKIYTYFDTSEERFRNSKHLTGPKCRCTECEKLKLLEDKWILKLGTLYDNGFNTRDEIKAKSRYN